MATARDRHRDWWKRFWLKSYIDTGDATLNKFYYGALYALGAASREGHFPPGTYAPWRTGDFSNLKNNYYLNYNTESQYYGVCSANRPELARRYYKLIASEIPYMRNLTHAAGYEAGRGAGGAGEGPHQAAQRPADQRHLRRAALPVAVRVHGRQEVLPRDDLPVPEGTR
ncbi:hypothetical protein [Streptomyces sp. 6N106]|uniref:hypothetical protein n=1 Tax=Streptomyces sp. 6N106 TaxID=3457418 RepID=UPI003FD4B67E